MIRAILYCLLFLGYSTSFAKNNILNLYTWAGDIPDSIIREFEHETNIHVNHLSYDSNETMLAKIKSSKKMQFDVIEPSHFYLSELIDQGILSRLSHETFRNVDFIDNTFMKDKKYFYAIPYFYGLTGILVNTLYHDKNSVKTWKDLWSPQYRHRLLLLNEPREVFSMALIALGFDPNTDDPNKIHAAYESIKKLFPNIKLFNSDAQLPLYIDEDLTIGMSWNNEASRIIAQNNKLYFIFPEEGFIFYYDCFAITRKAPHKKNAIRFLNFLLRPEIAAKVSKETHYAVTNRAALKLLPASIRNNDIIYPKKTHMKHGILQRSLSKKTLALYSRLWQQLKLTS